MNRGSFQRWLDVLTVEPITIWILLGTVAALTIAPLIVYLLARAGRIAPALRRELLQRCATWFMLFPLATGPVLLGATWVIATVTVLSLLCYREYARATGLFRDRWTDVAVTASIAGLALAAALDDDQCFLALGPIAVSLIAVASLLGDRPRLYLQRTDAPTAPPQVGSSLAADRPGDELR